MQFFFLLLFRASGALLLHFTFLLCGKVHVRSHWLQLQHCYENDYINYKLTGYLAGAIGFWGCNFMRGVARVTCLHPNHGESLICVVTKLKYPEDSGNDLGNTPHEVAKLFRKDKNAGTLRPHLMKKKPLILGITFYILFFFATQPW